MNEKIVRPQYQTFANLWMALVAVYWLIVAFGPVNSLGSIIIKEFFLGLPSFIETIQWLMLNIVCFALSITPAIHCAKLSRYTSYREMQTQEARERALESKPVVLGKVISARVERGGSFSSPTSTIETETGYYRVKGDIGTINKGTTIRKVHGNIFIGLVSNGRKYQLIN